VVAAADALHNVQRFGRGSAPPSKPGLIVETDRIHNERVAFPLPTSTRISRIQIFEVLPTHMDCRAPDVPLVKMRTRVGP